MKIIRKFYYKKIRPLFISKETKNKENIISKLIETEEGRKLLAEEMIACVRARDFFKKI
jgi:hypothetical protein